MFHVSSGRGFAPRVSRPHARTIENILVYLQPDIPTSCTVAGARRDHPGPITEGLEAGHHLPCTADVRVCRTTASERPQGLGPRRRARRLGMPPYLVWLARRGSVPVGLLFALRTASCCLTVSRLRGPLHRRLGRYCARDALHCVARAFANALAVDIVPRPRGEEGLWTCGCPETHPSSRLKQGAWLSNL